MEAIQNNPTTSTNYQELFSANLEQPEKINKWSKESRVFATMAFTTAAIAVGGTIKVIMGGASTVVPIAAAAALLILGITYLARRHLRARSQAEESQANQARQSFEIYKQQRDEIIQKLVPTKNEDEIKVELTEAINNIVKDITANPIVDNEQINNKIVDFFVQLTQAGVDTDVQEAKQQEILRAIQQVIIAKSLKQKGFCDRE